jgi:hypothetical protein
VPPRRAGRYTGDRTRKRRCQRARAPSWRHGSEPGFKLLKRERGNTAAVFELLLRGGSISGDSLPARTPTAV